MRTKSQILEDRRENIAHTTTPGNFSNYQGELLLEVLIDIRDELHVISNSLNGVDSMTFLRG